MGKVLLVITIGAMVLPSSAGVFGQTCEPTLLSVTDVFPASEPVRHVAVFGNTAIVATDNAIKVLDVSNPFSPVIQGELRNLDQFGLSITDIAMNENVAIYANRSNHLWLIDLSDPYAPREAGVIAPDFDFIHAVDVEGTTAYAVGNDLVGEGTLLHVLDISNPDAPSEVGLAVVGAMDAKSLAVIPLRPATLPHVLLPPRAYVGGKFHNNVTDFISMISFNISDNTNPQFLYQTQVSTTTPVDSLVNTIDIAAASTFAFPITRRDLYAIEADSGTARATTSFSQDLLAVEADEDYVFLSQGGVGLLIYDLANGTFPASFGLPCNTMLPSLAGVDIDLADCLLYVCGGAVNDLAILYVDRDGDGLCDSWEIHGIPYTDAQGVLRHFMLPDADPMHKNLYVEVDSMVGRGFKDDARRDVIKAFANAPNDLVDNPDDKQGITLYLLVDETDLTRRAYPNGWVEFDVDKAARFGTPTERNNPNWPNIKTAKKKAFRYCIFGESHGCTTSSGMAELPGNDFMVTLGSSCFFGFFCGGTVDRQAGTFMHKLGHTLDLGHGGGDDYPRKPNYYSVMNYTWQSPVWKYASYWRLDYSHVKLNSLNESFLDENAGIDSRDPDFAAIETPYGIGGEPPRFAWAKTNGTWVDWNGSGGDKPDPGTVAVDINYLFRRPQCNGPPIPSPSPGQNLEGHADWPNLHYALFGDSFADGVHGVTTEGTEMTLEMFEQLDAIPPPPGTCFADLDRDGQSGLADFSFFAGCMSGPEQPLASDCELANIDGDGDADLADFALFQATFGCP